MTWYLIGGGAGVVVYVLAAGAFNAVLEHIDPSKNDSDRGVVIAVSVLWPISVAVYAVYAVFGVGAAWLFRLPSRALTCAVRKWRARKLPRAVARTQVKS